MSTPDLLVKMVTYQSRLKEMLIFVDSAPNAATGLAEAHISFKNTVIVPIINRIAAFFNMVISLISISIATKIS